MRAPLLAVLGMFAIVAVAEADAARPTLHADGTDAMIESLLSQGVARGSIVRIDPRGIPASCEVVTIPGVRPSGRAATRLSASALPAGTRGWEVIPGVIRTNGTDTCRVEVDTNGPVARVTINSLLGFYLETTPGVDTLELHDDGVSPDRVAGDYIYTGGPLHYRTGQPFPSNYRSDASSPAGLFASDMGRVVIEELDHTLSHFLLDPQIGMLRADIPNRSIAATPAPDVVTMAHLINVKTSTRETQSFMRTGGDLRNVTQRIYGVLPDAFDFLVFFSTDKVEKLPYTSSSNFIAGLHVQAQVNFTGTGQGLYSGQGYYGSASRLLSLNLLDTGDRGIEGNNITHELTHQWAAFTNTALSDGTGHYGDCSVGSLVGGLLWTDNGNGTFTRVCSEGRNGAHHAPPLDLYLMGLVDASAVAPLHVATSPFSCTDPVTSWTNVTIADIQALHGQRVPKPAQAQKKFQIGFVAESHDRLLTPTELTFYEILAEHYTQTLPNGTPDPYMGFNWPPVTRYFANGSKWDSSVPAPRRPAGPAALMPATDGPARAGLAMRISPNPASNDVSFQWESSATADRTPVTLEIFDLEGRRVRRFAAQDVSGSIRWDGRDDQGRLVPAGAYTCRLSQGSQFVSRRFARVQ
jgi:hypothetical protein